MSRTGLTTGTGVGGNIEQSEFLSAVDKYENYHAWNGGNAEDRKSNYSDMVTKYYDLATSFIEFSWGQSFHFASRWEGESFQESIKRHEHFIALKLKLKPGQKVLDVGCGIGGPMREISRFSSTYITGLNNNEYQITRGKELNRKAGLSDICNFVQADFMKMPIPNDTYDAVYAIEATCHAPDVYGCYSEIYRVLKPGQCFAAYEICMTDSYDPNNPGHQKIKAGIEIGSGLPDIRTTRQCLEALKKAGFEVLWEKDLATDSPIPWYQPFQKNFFLLTSFSSVPLGRFFIRNTMKGLEYIGVAPKGGHRILEFLEKAAEGMIKGTRMEIFTPIYFILARKPHSGNQ